MRGVLSTVIVALRNRARPSRPRRASTHTEWTRRLDHGGAETPMTDRSPHDLLAEALRSLPVSVIVHHGADEPPIETLVDAFSHSPAGAELLRRGGA